MYHTWCHDKFWTGNYKKNSKSKKGEKIRESNKMQISFQFDDFFTKKFKILISPIWDFL